MRSAAVEEERHSVSYEVMGKKAVAEECAGRGKAREERRREHYEQMKKRAYYFSPMSFCSFASAFEIMTAARILLAFLLVFMTFSETTPPSLSLPGEKPISYFPSCLGCLLRMD